MATEQETELEAIAVAFGSRAVLGCGGENSRCPSSSYRSRHMDVECDATRIRDWQPGRFGWLRATIENGADTFPADHIPADYFVDEGAAAMLEYEERLKRSD